MDYVREHLDADGVDTVVEVDSHHRGDAAYAATGFLLHLGGQGYASGIGLRDTEAYYKTDDCAGDAPLDYHGAVFPKFGYQFHDVDFRFVVVWLVVDVFLHLFFS